MTMFSDLMYCKVQYLIHLAMDPLLNLNGLNSLLFLLFSAYPYRLRTISKDLSAHAIDIEFTSIIKNFTSNTTKDITLLKIVN
jgi:hypothetical protein